MAEMLRDTQRKKLYDAEKPVVKAYTRPVETVADVERFIKTQFKRKALVKRYGDLIDFENQPVKVADGRGTRSALAYGTSKISLPLWARHELIILHELAHVIHKRINVYNEWLYDKGSRGKELSGDSAAHGWQFAAIFIDLIHFIMGAEVADAMKASFKSKNVRWRPKKRVASRQPTERMIAGLAKARAARAANLQDKNLRVQVILQPK